MSVKFLSYCINNLQWVLQSAQTSWLHVTQLATAVVIIVTVQVTNVLRVIIMLAHPPLWLQADINLCTHNFMTFMTSVQAHWLNTRDFMKIIFLYDHLGVTYFVSDHFLLCDVHYSLRMEATPSFITSVPVYQTTWHHISEASNHKSHLNMFVSVQHTGRSHSSDSRTVVNFVTFTLWLQ